MLGAHFKQTHFDLFDWFEKEKLFGETMQTREDLTPFLFIFSQVLKIDWIY